MFWGLLRISLCLWFLPSLCNGKTVVDKCGPYTQDFDILPSNMTSTWDSHSGVFVDVERRFLIYAFMNTEYYKFDLVKDKLIPLPIAPIMDTGGFYSQGYLYYIGGGVLRRSQVDPPFQEEAILGNYACLGSEYTYCRAGRSIIVYPRDSTYANCYMNYTTTSGLFDDFDASHFISNNLTYTSKQLYSLACSPNTSRIYHPTINSLSSSVYISVDAGKYKNLTPPTISGIYSGFTYYSSLFIDTTEIYYQAELEPGKYSLRKYDIKTDLWQDLLVDGIISGLAYDKTNDYVFFMDYVDEEQNLYLSFIKRKVPFNSNAVYVFKPINITKDEPILTGVYVEPYYYVVTTEKIYRITCLLETNERKGPLIDLSEYSGPACGNGYIDDNEECDDGNVDSEDGCSFDCLIEDGWVCSYFFGNFIHSASACHVIDNDRLCGNGLLERQHGENCDDGNTVSGDGCDSDCNIECGYECEVMNKRSICRRMERENPICGDNIQDENEECDGGACSTDCKGSPGFRCTKTSDENNFCVSDCVDIDECAENDNAIEKLCAPRATCVNTNGSYECECRAPFIGDGYNTCNQEDYCKTATCNKNHVCVNDLTTHICKPVCPTGYAINTYDECVDFDECSIKNGLSYPPSYTCTGQSCIYCDTNAMCANSVGSFACTCKVGFVGNGFICAAFDCSNLMEGTRCIKSDYSIGSCKLFNSIMTCDECVLKSDADCNIGEFAGKLNKKSCSCETVAAPVCGSAGSICSSSGCKCCQGLVKDSSGRCQFPNCKTDGQQCTTYSNGTSNCCFGVAPVSKVCRAPTLKRTCSILGTAPTTTAPCCVGLTKSSSTGVCNRNSATQCSFTQIDSCCYNKDRNTCSCYCPTAYYV